MGELQAPLPCVCCHVDVLRERLMGIPITATLLFHLGLSGFLKVAGNFANGLAALAFATQRHFDKVRVPCGSKAEAQYQ